MPTTPINLQMSTRTVEASGFGGTVGVCEHPRNIKIVTTGLDGETLLNVGPPSGKKWTFSVQVSVIENDL